MFLLLSPAFFVLFFLPCLPWFLQFFGFHKLDENDNTGQSNKNKFPGTKTFSIVEFDPTTSGISIRHLTY